MTTLWMKENVCHVYSVPYAWFLPHCSVLVCHGGAIAVHVGLRAGAAIVMGDQFTFAKLLEAKGLGAQAGSSMNAMTQRDFQSALEKALGCVDATSAVGARIRQRGLAVDELVNIIMSPSGKQ